MATRYHGRFAKIYLQGSGDEAEPCVLMATWELSRKRDRVDATTFDDENKVQLTGFPDWSGSVSGFWASDSDLVYEASERTDGAKMYIYPARTASTKYHYCTVWIDDTTGGGVSDAVTLSFDFTAKETAGRI